MMIEFIAEQSQCMMNSYPSKKGISTTMSARNIMEGRPNLDYNIMSLKMGEYVHLLEGRRIHNTVDQ